LEKKQGVNEEGVDPKPSRGRLRKKEKKAEKSVMDSSEGRRSRCG